MRVLKNFLVPQVVGYKALGRPRPDDVYIAYLPLAHVLELLAELSFMIMGEERKVPPGVRLQL